MNNLNYFEPFDCPPHHENQLTRAFLVLLKYSNSSLRMFYNYCRQTLNNKVKNDHYLMPEYEEINYNYIHFETQTSNIDYTDKVISILISSQYFDEKREVKTGNRKAVYDGIIRFDDKLCFVIENKLDDNVTTEQHVILSHSSLQEDIEIIKTPVILEWKTILRRLNNLLNLNNLDSFEFNMIEDFRDFVNEYFEYLNPFDRLSSCRNSESLLLKRIRNILRTITINDDLVEYHRGWAWVIKIYWSEIREIGLLLIKKPNSEEWSLKLSLWFAQLVSQARPFYQNNNILQNIKNLGENWQKKGVLFIRHRGSPLGKYEIPDLYVYINYWLQNINNIRRYSNKNELFSLLEELNKNKIAEISNNDLLKLQNDTEPYPHLDIGPGFNCYFEYSSQNAIILDDDEELVNSIKENIINGLRIIDRNIDFLK